MGLELPLFGRGGDVGVKAPLICGMCCDFIFAPSCPAQRHGYMSGLICTSGCSSSAASKVGVVS